MGNEFGICGWEDFGNGFKVLFVFDGVFNSGNGVFKMLGMLFL